MCVKSFTCFVTECEIIGCNILVKNEHCVNVVGNSFDQAEIGLSRPLNRNVVVQTAPYSVLETRQLNCLTLLLMRNSAGTRSNRFMLRADYTQDTVNFVLHKHHVGSRCVHSWLIKLTKKNKKSSDTNLVRSF